MSEADRLRRLSVEVRLAQLRARHGEPEQNSEPEANPDPSWGPVGSLARAHMDPTTYAYLLALHNDALELERSRKDPGMARPTQPAPRPPEPARIDIDVRLA